MSTFANSKDPDEMQHNAAFHQALHCLKRSKRYSDKGMQYFRKIITCHPKFIVSNQKEESIGIQRALME